MKILIAVSSCAKYEQNHQAMVDTWLSEAASLGMDYKFFVEKNSESKVNTIVTDTEEWAITDRLKAKSAWALVHGYDFLFSCFPDTYARSERLLVCGFDRFDYFGNVRIAPDNPFATFYCQGGAGYFLSKAAMYAAANDSSSYLNDDCWLGDVISKTRLTRGHSEDFRQHVGSPLKDNTIITSHLSYKSCSLGVPYEAKFMYEEHKQWLDSGGTLVPYVPRIPTRIMRLGDTRWRKRL